MAPETVANMSGLARFRQNVQDEACTVEVLTKILIHLLRNREIREPKDSAEATALLLCKLVEVSQVPNDLLADILEIAKRLVEAAPRQPAIGNMAKRVLGLVREENERDRREDIDNLDEASNESLSGRTTVTKPSPAVPLQEHTIPRTSLFQILTKDRARRPSDRRQSMQTAFADVQVLRNDTAQGICQDVAEGIQELLDELRQVDDQISMYALEHIHPNETILVNTLTTDIVKFLVKAAGKRSLSIVLLEDPSKSSSTAYNAIVGPKGQHSIATQASKTLAGAGVTVTLAPDSAAFGLMPCISKVLLSASSVFPDGSFLCSTGAKGVTLAAKFHRVPVLVLAGVYKICPQLPYNDSKMLSSKDVKVHQWPQFSATDRHIEFHHSTDDYISTDLVNLFISNVGAHSPKSLNRVISDHYGVEDL